MDSTPPRSDGRLEPPVSWLLPVKNGMPFLRETLESIQAQTYRNWQVLAWDNGSTDDTVDELRRWIPDRLPGHVVSDHPLPLADSRCALLELAESELVANIDADDVNHPERLARQVSFLASDPGLAAISCHYERMDETGRFLRLERLPLDHPEIVNGLLRPSPLCNGAALMRRSCVVSVGGYRPLRVAEDYDLWLRLATRYRLGNLDFVGLRYRVRENGAVRSSIRDGSLTECTALAASQSGSALFGVSSEDLRLLFLRRARFAWPTLVKMALHLDATQGAGPRLRSKSYMRSVKRLVGPKDVRTQFAVFLFRMAGRSR